MPDTILIDEYDPNDEIEVITKFDLDDDVPIDELNESAEFFLDELIMQTAEPEIPVYSIVRDMSEARSMLDEIIPKPKMNEKHVTASTIETLVGIEIELQDDDGSDLQFLMDTLTGEE